MTRACPPDLSSQFAVVGTYDVKMLRKYSYETGDTLCRLCVKEDETVDHIVNRCEKIYRSTILLNVNSLEREDVETVVARAKLFVNLVEEMKDITE